MNELVLQFQNQWTSTIKDEYLCQYFQLITNCFLWIHSNQKDFIKKFQDLHYNPLSALITKYRSQFTKIIKKMETDLKGVNREQEKLQRLKESYFKNGNDVEKATKNLEEMISKEKTSNNYLSYPDQESLRTAANFAKIKLNKSKSESEYISALDTVNKQWFFFHDTFDASTKDF